MKINPDLNSLAFTTASEVYSQAVCDTLLDTLNVATVEEVIVRLKTASFLALWRHDNEVGEKDLTYTIIDSPHRSFKATLRYNASLRSILSITLTEGAKEITVETTFTRDIISKLSEFYFGENP